MSLVKPQISVSQLVVLLLINRVSIVLNYAPIFTHDINLTALLIGNIISIAIGFLLLIPIVLFQKNHGHRHIIDVALTKNRVFGFIVGFSFFVFIIFHMIGSIVGFEFFMTNAIYPNASPIFIVLTIVPVCFWCAKNGIEGIGRTGTLVITVFMIGIAFIAVVASKSVDLINIKPIADETVNSIFSAVLYSVSHYLELAMILLVPNVKGSYKRTGTIYLVLSTILVEIITFFIASVLGEYAYSQTYPYYSLASIIETDMLQRLDSIHMMLWVFVSFVRIVLHAVIAGQCLRTMFPKLSFGWALLATLVVITPISIYVSLHPEIINANNTLGAISTILLVVIVPLCLLKKSKEDRHEETIKGEHVTQS